MTARKKSDETPTEAAAYAAADAAAIDEALEELGEAETQIASELAQLEAAQAEAARLRDRHARLQAEWDNFRKRVAAEREQERSRAAERLVEKLLPVIDDLERAVNHSDTASGGSLKEGVAAVFSKFNEVLKQEGLTAIDPLDEAFDANVHQAVATVEDASVPDETVVQVYQKGYRMADRVLRPATVAVSSSGPRRSEAGSKADATLGTAGDGSAVDEGT